MPSASRRQSLGAELRPGPGTRGGAVKLSQLLTFPNQLTLLRMSFLPFIVIRLVDGHYGVALILFVLAGMSDGLDGLLARALKQQTVLGQYLDPIADKMLLSTVFLVLSILHKIPWKFTVVVFSRDLSILAASTVLFAIAGLRDFRPSVFGKANTFAQVAAVFFVLLLQIRPERWIAIARLTFLRATFTFTIISAIHYVYLVGKRLRANNLPGATVAAEPRGI
jgi:cardiolipin synthase